MARYQDVLAWKECHALALGVYQVTRPFPKSELYGLTSQLRRAASSAPTNIVEGLARRGTNELRYFLNIALGSLSEVEYLLQLSHELEILPSEEWKAMCDLQRRARFLTWQLLRAVQTRSRQRSA
ncbi:MAG: four helix bundle protein [Gemmatimonadetes bacterium]|nr:MAG: four helix bundle protein [Gemmatimonadota bacterium]